MSKVDCKTVQELYPNPEASTVSNPIGAYCVGGALCQTVYDLGLLQGEDEGVITELARHLVLFPDSDDLAYVLAFVNPELRWEFEDIEESDWDMYEKAVNFAEEIITRNDDDKFEESWAKLCEALDRRN